MAEHGISLQQVQGILLANQITMPSGAIDEGDLRLPVSTEHRFTSIEELEAQIVGASAPAGAAAAARRAAGRSGSAPAGPAPAPPRRGIARCATARPRAASDGDGDAGRAWACSCPTSGARRGPGIHPHARDAGSDRLHRGARGQRQRLRAHERPAVADGQHHRSARAPTPIDVADAVEAVFAETEAQHGDVVDVAIIQDQSQFIRESQTGLVQEGLLGALFAVLVIYVFLRSARTTLVAAISIPLSILIAIAVFGVAGLSINILTLGGLAVAVGRVVDDSIVVLENIYRHRGLGRCDRTTPSSTAPARSPAPSPARPSRRWRSSCRSASSAASSASSSCPSAWPSPSRCWPR